MHTRRYVAAQLHVSGLCVTRNARKKQLRELPHMTVTIHAVQVPFLVQRRSQLGPVDGETPLLSIRKLSARGSRNEARILVTI